MKTRKVSFEIEVPIWLEDENLKEYFNSLFGKAIIAEGNPMKGHDIKDLFPSNLKIK